MTWRDRRPLWHGHSGQLGLSLTGFKLMITKPRALFKGRPNPTLGERLAWLPIEAVLNRAPCCVVVLIAVPRTIFTPASIEMIRTTSHPGPQRWEHHHIVTSMPLSRMYTWHRYYSRSDFRQYRAVLRTWFVAGSLMYMALSGWCSADPTNQRQAPFPCSTTILRC